MRVFVYEYVTGGGWLAQKAPPSQSLLCEARAMVWAVAADFAQLAGTEVIVMRDARLNEDHATAGRTVKVFSVAQEQAAFRQLAAEADWTLLIAPETGGVLLERARMVAAVGGKLLSPPPECIEVAADKQRTAERLGQAGIRAPQGSVLTPASRSRLGEMGFPLVAKPVDGCGSQAVQRIENADELAALPSDASLRVERFCPGLAASVSLLCGPRGDFALPACQQLLSRDGRFVYLGGRLPLSGPLAERARRLATSAVRAMGSRYGYLGVDLVLGDASDGSDDVVIEVNPRLTTSYVGLRAAATVNLAAAMLAVCQGRPPDLAFAQGAVEFTADGQIHSRSSVA